MNAALASLASRRIILFGGKGGVGKTTISALAALHFAEEKPVILFTTDPASNLRDIFPGDDRPNLRIEQLDTASLYQRFLGTNLESFLEIADRGTYLDREELRRFFELSLPGADELMAWMRIGELAEEHPDARVIVDTAPTGHALRMFGAAEHFRQFASALDSMQEKHRSLVQQFTRQTVSDAEDAFIDDFEATARRRLGVLTDPAQTAFVPVLLSEPWVVEQTIRLIDEVREGGIDVPVAILNRAVLNADCDRCRARQAADHAAKVKLAPLPVFDFERSCAPLFPPPARSLVLVPPSSVRALDIPAAKLIFLAGKGGVGKTTCAASIALQLATNEPGSNFTIISVDPAHAIRDVFADEAPPPNLTVELIDTRAKWRRFRDTLGLEIEKAIDALTPKGMTLAYDTEALQKLIEVAPPGADELFAINRLAALVADDSQTRVIVDTAPTGHFLRLLDLPTTAGEWVREFMRILLRYRDLIPTGSLGAELVNASKSLTLLRETLRSDRSAVFVVTRPERIVVAETNRLIEELRSRGIATAGVIANYVTAESECACDREMRTHELAALSELAQTEDRGPRTGDRKVGRVLLVERRESPVIRLDELARLFVIESDSAQ